MPAKFVARAAERAGVSLDTAEHRWAEAKKAVKKGKRRGSWYWGKVMNTFKRMMGLMEGVTFKDYLLLEAEVKFDSWPKNIRLYGPYVAVRVQHLDHYIKYEVQELMGDRIDVQLAAALIRGHNDAYEGGASYTLGKNGHFNQGLGIKVPAGEAFDVAEFRKWAIEAMKTGAAKLGLTEAADGMPNNIKLAGPYVAVKDVENEHRASYKVKKLLSDDDVQLRISVWYGKSADNTGGMWTFRPTVMVDDILRSQVNYDKDNMSDIGVRNVKALTDWARRHMQYLIDTGVIDSVTRRSHEDS